MTEQNNADKNFILSTELAIIAMKRRDKRYTYPDSCGVLIPSRANVIIQTNVFDLNLDADIIQYDSLDQLLLHWLVD